MLAVDSNSDHEILSVNGAAAALMLSDIPWNGPIGVSVLCGVVQGCMCVYVYVCVHVCGGACMHTCMCVYASVCSVDSCSQARSCTVTIIH